MVLQVVPSAQMHCLMIKGTSSYRLCFKYFSQLFSILDWFKNVYIISSCFERWWCNKAGQACNLEIILVKTAVRSVWFDDFWSLFQNSCWLCIHFWINLELRRVGKNIWNNDDRMNSLYNKSGSLLANFGYFGYFARVRLMLRSDRGWFCSRFLQIF